MNAQQHLDRVAPLLIRNLYANNRNPEAIEQQKSQREARATAEPITGQSAEPPELHDTGELKEKFARAFAERGFVDRHAKPWDESKHPRASDGRFGDKPGEHASSEAVSPDGTKTTATAQAINDIVYGDGKPDKDGSQTDEPTTPPPPGGYSPDPQQVDPKTGYADTSRVGVPGWASPPPPRKIPRLPNLSADERRAENAFASAYERDPDGVANKFMRGVMAGAIPSDGPNVFATDDAKYLSGDWNPSNVSEQEQFDARALYNTATHQTANAIAKRAFTQYLDEVVSKLPEDRKFVVATAGGVASGKGYAIQNVGEVNSLSQQAGAVWDAAGEQNSSELPWVHAECKKRGIKMVAAYIHSTPDITYPRAVFRANQKGRMVDARVFADSYKIGADNFERFQQQTAGDDSVQTIVIDSKSASPRITDRIPHNEKPDPDETYRWAVDWIQSRDEVENPFKPGQMMPLSPAIKRAATAGTRIWGKQQAAPYVPVHETKPNPLANLKRTDAKPNPLGAKPAAKRLFSREANTLTRQFAEAFSEIGM